jgi:hypothetical protein
VTERSSGFDQPSPSTSGDPSPAPASLKLRDSLTWRREFLAKLIPDLEARRLRTRDGEVDSTEETVQRLRLRLAEIEARIGAADRDKA